MKAALRHLIQQAVGGVIFYVAARQFFTCEDDTPEGRMLALAPVLVPVTLGGLIFWMEGIR